MAIEIVSFPIKKMVIFHSYVSLPEGNFVIMLSHHGKFAILDACIMY